MVADEEKMLKEMEQADQNEQDESSPPTPRLVTPNSTARDMGSVDWKLMIARYCRLTPKEAKGIGVDVSSDPNYPRADEKNHTDDNEDANQETADDMEEDMMDEVNGIHFMSFTALFVAYIYVCSASKVFEGRITSTHIAESVPDFEAVYHLVIDAVETYNDSWKNEFRLQEVGRRRSVSRQRV